MEFKLTGKGQQLDSKLKTAVFVDFENWHDGCKSQFGILPDVSEWYADLKNKGQILDIWFFANFARDDLKAYPPRLRTVSNNIINCTKEFGSKCTISYVMLDFIYQTLIKNPDIEQFILFTHETNFQSVLAFLRHFRDKRVGIYSVDGLLSSALEDAVDWYVKVLSDVSKRDIIACAIRDKITWNSCKGIISTFKRTVDSIHKTHRGFTEDEIAGVLKCLIQTGQLRQEHVTNNSGFTYYQIKLPKEAVESEQKSDIEVVESVSPKKTKTRIDREALLQFCKENPTATHVAAARYFNCSESGIRGAKKALGI